MGHGVTLISGCVPIPGVRICHFTGYIVKHSVRKSWTLSSLRPATGKPTALRPTSGMSSKDFEETKRDEHTLEHNNRDSEAALDPDAEFGGTEARKKLEKRLLFKLDTRMSILIVIYILNYVSRTL